VVGNSNGKDNGFVSLSLLKHTLTSILSPLANTSFDGGGVLLRLFFRRFSASLDFRLSFRRSFFFFFIASLFVNMTVRFFGDTLSSTDGGDQFRAPIGSCWICGGVFDLERDQDGVHCALHERSRSSRSRGNCCSCSTLFSFSCSQFLLRSRSREIDLAFDRDRLCTFLLLCFFSRALDVLFGDLLRDLLRFLERLRDLYFFVFSFRLSRDLDSDRLRRLGDSDRRLRDSERDLLREMEYRLDRDRLRDLRLI